MGADNGNSTEIADLVLQLGRAAYAECSGSGLTQAQWIAIRYFARANRFSRNISGFADFHATTRGTASQTVKSLVEQGFLVRQRSAADGRSVRFELTATARKKLREDPMENVVRVAGQLTDTQLADTANGLRTLLQALEQDRSRSLIGACHLCGNLQTDNGAYHCRLMQESLAQEELAELCIRFQPAE